MPDPQTAPADPPPIGPINLELRWQTVCLMVLTTLALGATLYVLRPVLVPFVLALFFTIGLSPLLDFIERRLGSTRLVAVAIAFLLGLLALTLLGLLIWGSVASLEENREQYRKSLDAMVVNAIGWCDDLGLTSVSEKLENLASNFSNFLGQQGLYWQERILLFMKDLMGTLVMVLIFMFFLLLGASGAVRPTEGLWPVIESKFREYLVAKTVISIFTGLAFGVVLWFFGVPLALVMGLLAFLLNYIPNVGPIIASVLPIPLILVTPELGIAGKIAAVACSSAVQVVSGNVIEPKLMGESFELHPIVILLSLMLWGMIWGIVGMLLAVPITAAIRIVLERIDKTRPVAELMAGRLDALKIDPAESSVA